MPQENAIGAITAMFIHLKRERHIISSAKSTKSPTLAFARIVPPHTVKIHVKDQLVTVLWFRATPVRDPQKFIKDQSIDNDDADKVFLKLHRLTSEEILLDHTTPLCEIVDIWDPNTDSYTPSLVQYDCAAGLCLIQDGSHLNMKPEPEPAASAEIQCMNATTRNSLTWLLLDYVHSPKTLH